MKARKVNRLLLRLFPFVIFIAWLIDFIFSWNNINIGMVFHSTFGISLITIIPLWLAVECDCKYNCKHIRWMYGCILLCQLINVFDYTFNVFPSYKMLFLYI